jgi:adenylate cyclase, class 2
MIEREIKLAFSTADEARDAIVAAGATPLHARRLQDDTLYDTSDGMLRQRGRLLRLREDGDTAYVTYKGPASVASGMKVREERETTVGDASTLRAILAQIGMRPWFRYQKYREELTRPGVLISIDETPVGVFVEIEGDEAAVTAAAKALGRGPEAFVSTSYYRLFLTRRQQYGITGDDMLFEAR